MHKDTILTLPLLLFYFQLVSLNKLPDKVNFDRVYRPPRPPIFPIYPSICIGSYQKHVTMKGITCNSFPWNKAGDFRTPILCPNMDKNKFQSAHAGKCRATLHPNKEIFKLKRPQLWIRIKRFKVIIFWSYKRAYILRNPPIYPINRTIKIFLNVQGRALRKISGSPSGSQTFQLGVGAQPSKLVARLN